MVRCGAAIQPGDVVLFLGAGDITKAAHELAGSLRDPHPAGSSETGAAMPLIAPVQQPDPVAAMKPELFDELAAKLSPESAVRRDEPLARRTTLRVGGTADFYAEPASENDLAEILRFCAAHQLPVFILGRGSNLLIRDGGIRGMVICLAHPHFSEVRIQGERLRCGAGARLKTVAVEAKRNGLSGLEFLEGIPGSVGGAMRMNAGAMGSWLFDVVTTIRFMDYNGAIHERAASEVNVEYRGCPLFKDHIALEAELQGQPAPKEASKLEWKLSADDVGIRNRTSRAPVASSRIPHRFRLAG